MPAPSEIPADTEDAPTRLARVRAAIADAGAGVGRRAGDVTLVAISKTHDPAAIRPVIEAGHRVFGENRVQEAAAKWPGLRAGTPGIELHLVGPLQTNKARDAVALFDVIETVDRPKLAAALAREMERTGKHPRCYIQVNTGNEPQKAGVAPTDADAFIALCRDQHGLQVDGLMCIPPADEEPSLHFALLAKIAARNGLGVLSMGMSGDFEIAVQFGATHVRVGTAIFGPRR
jgi:hypothetical protein